MNPLTSWLGNWGVSNAVLEKARNTVIVVGEFNPDTEGLFVLENGDLNPAFADMFDDRGPVTIDAFTGLVKPSVTKRHDRIGGFAVEVLERPNASGAREVLSSTHPFVKQAVDNYQHTRARPSVRRRAEPHPGVAVFQQVSRGNADWAKAQVFNETHVDALSEMLAMCSGQEGLAHYARGGPLPPNLKEEFVRGLFDDRPLDLSRVEFTGAWAALADPGALGRGALANVAGALKEALIGTTASQYSGLTIYGHGTLHNMAVRIAGAPTRAAAAEAFRAGRTGRKRVIEVLRSRLRLSQILDWVLKALEDLVRTSLPNDAEEHDYITAMETAVMTGAKLAGAELPQPIVRPDDEQRAKFGDMLGTEFERVFTALVADEKAFPALRAALPDEFARVVDQLRTTGNLCATLRSVSGGANADVRAGFLKANKMLMRALLVSELCVPVTLSRRRLKEEAKRDLLAVYLCAVGLDVRNEAEVRAIAARNVNAFKQIVHECDKATPGTRSFVAKIIEEYVRHLTNERTAKRLEAAVNNIEEALAVYEFSEDRAAERIWDILPQHPETVRKKYKVGTATPHGTADTKALLRPVVRKQAENRIAIYNKRFAVATTAVVATAPVEAKAPKAKAKPAGAKPDPNGHAAPKTEPAPSTEVADAPHEPKALAEANTVIDSFLTKYATGVNKDEAEVVIEEATEVLAADEKFVSGLTESFAAFKKVLFFVHDVYSDADIQQDKDKAEFRRAVERLSLLSLMLDQSDGLGLGADGSSLLALIADAVGVIDVDNPDPKALLKKFSLTKYIERVSGALKALWDSIRIAEASSRDNVGTIVSDVYGMHYLIEQLATVPKSAIIVFNMNWKKFLRFVGEDGLVRDQGTGMFRLGRWTDAGAGADQFVVASGIYFCDSAFDGDKIEFATALKNLKLASDDYQILLPPIIVDAGRQASGYRGAATAVLDAAAGAPVALHCLGPKFAMKAPRSEFETALGAGFVALAHLLGATGQSLRTPNVPEQRLGRYCPLPAGDRSLTDSLDRWLYGSSIDVTKAASKAAAKKPDEAAPGTSPDALQPPYLADLFGYLVLGLAETVRVANGTAKAGEFYANFFFDPQQPASFVPFERSKALEPALPCRGLRLALANEVIDAAGNQVPLSGMLVALPDEPDIAPGQKPVLVRDLAWWNKARTAARVW